MNTTLETGINGTASKVGLLTTRRLSPVFHCSQPEGMFPCIVFLSGVRIVAEVRIARVNRWRNFKTLSKSRFKPLRKVVEGSGGGFREPNQRELPESFSLPRRQFGFPSCDEF